MSKRKLIIRDRIWKYGLCGDRHETVYHIISGYNKLTQREYKSINKRGFFQRYNVDGSYNKLTYGLVCLFAYQPL